MTRAASDSHRAALLTRLASGASTQLQPLAAPQSRLATQPLAAKRSPSTISISMASRVEAARLRKRRGGLPRRVRERAERWRSAARSPKTNHAARCYRESAASLGSAAAVIGALSATKWERRTNAAIPANIAPTQVATKAPIRRTEGKDSSASLHRKPTTGSAAAKATQPRVAAIVSPAPISPDVAGDKIRLALLAAR